MAQANYPFTAPPLCTQFGFTPDARAARLALLDLADNDRSMLQRILNEAILPNSEAIMDGFYNFLFSFDAMRQFLGRTENLARLRLTQHEYLSSFGLDFDSAEYFEYRLRIGVAHERIGMPLHLYLAAYREMQALVIQALPASLTQPPDLHAQCIDAITKIMMLDMSLAIDTYTNIRIDSLADSIQALEHERDILNNQLMHDTLTGCLSRRFVLESLGKHLSHLARQPEHKVCVALLDLDHFKSINDTYGHPVGDIVLREFVSVVDKIVREQDYFGRFGGEEFLLIITDLSAPQAQEVVERIRQASQQHIYQVGQYALRATFSAGLIQARPNESVDALIERADIALYQAKKSGRNRIVMLTD